jgi:two-component system response regulator YesN
MTTKIESIVDFMEANLNRKLTLEEIAQSVKLSPSHLSHLVKLETGMPPGQYLKMLRMKRTCELLESTSLSVKEIMVKVGIQDKSHFTQDFKNIYSVTPSQYRKRLASKRLIAEDG